MIATLLYIDGAGYKTFIKLPVPKELEKKISLGDNIEIEEFEQTPNWLWEQTNNGYDPEYDHNLVKVIELNIPL